MPTLTPPANNQVVQAATAPVLTLLTPSPARCVTGESKKSTSYAFGYRLSSAATLTFRLDRRKGGATHTTCPKSTSSIGSASDWLTPSSITKVASGSLHTAASKSGRLTATASLPKNLHPGRYRLLVTATAGGLPRDLPIYLLVLSPRH